MPIATANDDELDTISRLAMNMVLAMMSQVPEGTPAEDVADAAAFAAGEMVMRCAAPGQVEKALREALRVFAAYVEDMVANPLPTPVVGGFTGRVQ